MARIILFLLLPLMLFGQKIKYNDFSPQLKADLATKTTMRVEVADSLDWRLGARDSTYFAGTDSLTFVDAAIDTLKFWRDGSVVAIAVLNPADTLTINNNADDSTLTESNNIISVKDGLYLNNININTNLNYNSVSLFDVGKNKFNYADTTNDYYVNDASGSLASNASYWASDYCKISPSTTYTWSGGQDETYDNGRHLAWYDADKTYISGVNGVLTTHTSPGGAYFMRFSNLDADADAALVQVEAADTSTTYAAYQGATVDWSRFNTTAKDSAQYTKKQEDDLFNQGKNLFNPVDITEGYYVNWNNGRLAANATYNSSDYIIIEPSTNYCITNGTHYSWYDAEQTFISGSQTITNPITAPATALYIRLDYYDTNVDSFQVMLEQANEPTYHLAYGYYIDPEVIGSLNDVRLLLPDTVYISASDTTEYNIYYENIIVTTDYHDYVFKVTCDSGRAWAQGWRWTPDAATTGEYDWSIDILNEANYPVAHGSTILKVAANTDVASTDTILVIGDSQTNGNQYPAEMFTMSGGVLNFIGTLDTGTDSPNEGRSGYSFSNFENQVGSPFVNDGDVDIENYLSTNGFNDPNLITIMLGTNDIYGSTELVIDADVAEAFSYADSIIAGLHSACPNAQIGIAYLLPPAYSYDAGPTRWAVKRGFHRWNEMLKAKWGVGGTDEETYITLIPINLGYDTEHNVQTDTPVYNSRNSDTYTRTYSAGNALIHPGTSGYLQVADYIYGWVVNH